MKKWLKISLYTLVGAAAVGFVCAFAVPWSHSTIISCVGSSGVKPFVEEYAKTYSKTNNVDINVDAGGSGFGISQIANNFTNIGCASKNPFEGLSHYDKNVKQRRNHIAKTIEKEENQFNEIMSLEEYIIKKRELNEKGLNKLIITLTKFVFDDNEKNLENKDSYEYKINKACNIIKFMKEENQKKIMEELRKNAKDDYSIEIFEILKGKIDDYKEKLVKVYKIEEKSNNGEKDVKRTSSIKRSIKKSIKKIKKR